MAEDKEISTTQQPAEKLAYVAPKTVHLGSVRELTANGAGSTADLSPGLLRKMLM